MFADELDEINQLKERIYKENEILRMTSAQNEQVVREIQWLEGCKTEKELVIDNATRKLHQRQEEIAIIKDDLMKKCRTNARSMWRYKEYMDKRFHVTESDIYVISFLKDGNIMGHIDCRYEEENDCWSVSKIVFDGYDISALTGKVTNIICLQKLLYIVHEWLAATCSSNFEENML